MKRLRNYFISGLLFWIPLGLSVVVIKFFIDFLDGIIPEKYQLETLLGLTINIPGMGMLLVLLVTLTTGALISNFIGAKVLEAWECFLNKIPGFRGIYSSLKQLSSTVLSPSGESFKNAVLIEYPKEGLWTIAFQTSNYQGEMAEKIGAELINIYVPTTPNPTSGFYLLVAKDKVKVLDMHVDDAFKLIISTGVVTPKQEQQ
jgi:uncharacterized membrane protein